MKNPRHFSHMMNVIRSTLLTQVAKCSTTRLSRGQELRKFKSSVSLVSGKFSTDPVMRSCLAHVGSTSRRVTKANLSTAVDWSCKSTKGQADWSFFPATPPLEALRSLLICGTIEELSNDVGQPVAWSEPVVLMLIDVRRAHFYSPNIVTVCKAFVCWVELWNGSGSSTCRTDGEIVRSDWSISLDTWSQRQA